MENPSHPEMLMMSSRVLFPNPPFGNPPEATRSYPPPIDRSTKPKKKSPPLQQLPPSESESTPDVETSSTDASLRRARLGKFRSPRIVNWSSSSMRDAEVTNNIDASSTTSTEEIARPRKLTKPRRQPSHRQSRSTVVRDPRSSVPYGARSDDLGSPPVSSGPLSLSQTNNAEPRGLQNAQSSAGSSNAEPQGLGSLVTTVDVKSRYDPENELKTAGKWKVARQKRVFVAILIAVNFMFVFATWWWPRYYYIYLPFITITVFLNAVMVVSIMFNSVRHRVFPEKQIIPTTPESLVFIVPCYNESPEELTRSLDSLANQTGIDQHRRCIMIIVDGKVRGPGMEKSTAEYLLDDMLVERKYRRYIKNAYIDWTQDYMDVEIQAGNYKGLPYLCMVKQQNRGKRDSLIVCRSFLYNFNIRAERPEVTFSAQFFGEMASYLINDGKMDNVTCLVGMDGDTVFSDNCVSELIKESHYPNTVGVCGYVAVDFTRGRFGNFSLWNLYQNAEYTISQGLRRLHQSIVTHKVSCLPGCCQLLRVCETTCGDKVLRQMFGYCPTPLDSLLKHTRATASEDRNHVCLMLSAFPKAETRQALRARAYTDVPHSWSVFLSQRRRWTLGATANDLFLVTAPGIYWFERILAFANCLVWFINIFVFASVACLIAAILHVEGYIILSFSAIMIIPVLYYFTLVVWLPQNLRERVQYVVGCLLYICGGPFLNIIVLLYAIKNMDSFGWGKTRRVISEVEAEKEPLTVPLDEEAEIGMRPPLRRSSPRADILAIIGSEAYAIQLLKAFGKHYRTIAYDPSDESCDRIRQQFSPADGYSIDTTSDDQELAKANVFLITSPPSNSPSRPVNAYNGSPGPSLYLHEAVDIVSRHVKPGAIVMVESTVSVGTTRSLLSPLAFRGAFCGFSPAPSTPSPRRTSTSFTNSTKLVSSLNLAPSIDSTTHTSTPSPSLNQITQLYRRPFPRTVTVPQPEVAELMHLLDTAAKHSQAMLSSELDFDYEYQQQQHPALRQKRDINRMSDDLRKISAMWKNFVTEAENGLKTLPLTPPMTDTEREGESGGIKENRFGFYNDGDGDVAIANNKYNATTKNNLNSVELGTAGAGVGTVVGTGRQMSGKGPDLARSGFAPMVVAPA